MSMKSSIADYTVNNDKLWGIYRGHVEDNKDPELLCRCRVRVLGVHDELKDKGPLNGIPTEELPWAEPCFGLYQGSVSGQGVWTVPVQGCYVFVFFEDGNWMQPRFFLSAPGTPELPPNGKIGFNDPEEVWPDHTGAHSWGKPWLDEADPHRLMKRDYLGPTSLIEVKEPSIRKAVDIAIGGDWTETPPMYEAKYPWNTVVHGWSGLYFEVDHTPEAPRFHLYHPSNSYVEINKEGDMTIRNNLNRWDIVMEMRFEETVSDFHRLTRGERSSKVLKNEYEEIIESSYRKIHVDDRKDVMDTQWYHIFVDEKLWVDNLREEYIGLTDFEYVVDKKTSFVGADCLKRVDGNKKTHVVGDNIIQAEGSLILRSDFEIIIEAPVIELRGWHTGIYTLDTEIAHQLRWGGVALGILSPIMQSIPNVAETPVEPIPVEVPPFPPDIDPPPPPPKPPVYDYTDIPAEIDKCP